MIININAVKLQFCPFFDIYKNTKNVKIVLKKNKLLVYYQVPINMKGKKQVLENIFITWRKE